MNAFEGKWRSYHYWSKQHGRHLTNVFKTCKMENLSKSRHIRIYTKSNTIQTLIQRVNINNNTNLPILGGIWMKKVGSLKIGENSAKWKYCFTI